MTTNNPLQQGIQQGIQDTVKGTWQSLLALGISSILLGVVIAAWPGPSTLAAGILFGIFLIVSGIFQVVAGLIGETDHRVLSVISGALSLVLGAFCFRDDIVNSIAILGIWIGISWIFAGVTSITTGIAGKLLPHRTWLVILGILTLLGGFVLIASPWDSMFILMLVTGIWAIAIGIVEVIAALQVRGKAKQVGQRVSDFATGTPTADPGANG
ncbi:HdeD family acid-resistance protein [Tsukamurella sp. 1534]|uniref:HdeD family acid-resistance protein n=1 Tax=Tsukamurella sp. 1534 TaxID=1151061 RepID=UPI0006ACF957|nr:HdeD family acid-resistance protein [Tsukamurella sp. 1534]